MQIAEMSADEKGYQSQAVTRLRDGQYQQGEDQIAQEVAVALVFNGIAFAVMMASPTALDDFAYGFAFSEGIIDHAAQIYDIETTCSAQGVTLDISIAAACFARLKDKKRQLAGRTGCGLCGVESLAQAIRQPAPVLLNRTLHATAISSAIAAMREQQILLQATGSSHAAAWCNADGTVYLIREDVGRHNALDKVIGACLSLEIDASQGFICITSRASYEMVQKTASAGIPLLAAVSGVTSLAIEVAQQAGLSLLGFTRGLDFSIYSHPQRIQIQDHE